MREEILGCQVTQRQQKTRAGRQPCLAMHICLPYNNSHVFTFAIAHNICFIDSAHSFLLYAALFIGLYLRDNLPVLLV